MTIKIFAYGSLMNPESRSRTLPGERRVRKVTLLGYQRKMNAPVDGYLYLNIVPREGMRVKGVLVHIGAHELEGLCAREPGYALVDVTGDIRPAVDGVVCAFIAPNRRYPGMKIPRSYLETCQSNMSPGERETWLRETLIENAFEEDVSDPVYANARRATGDGAESVT